MKQIEAGLHAHHARLAAAVSEENTASPAVATSTPPTASTTVRTAEIHAPFAKINSVADGSPASDAGMKKGDYIKKFDWVHALNHENLKKLTECVAANDGVCTSHPFLPLDNLSQTTHKGGYVNGFLRVLLVYLEQLPISVLLSRKEAGSDVDREVTIVPRVWAGNGKLGCHILPL